MNQIRVVNVCCHRFANDLKCIRCGAYNHKNQVIKTNKYTTPFHFNLNQYLRSLRNSATQVVQPKQISEDTHSLLSSICDKFQFTSETLALGLYIYQCLNKLNLHQSFWASACLIIAGKSGQLDKNVPYLNRYQRYADKCFSQYDYQQAQRVIFQSMNFEVQYSTVVTFVDFYLTCGVLFRSDDMNEVLVQFFEDDICQRVQQFLKNGTFTKYQPQKLALSIIKETRLKFNLEGWTQQLQKVSGFCSEDINIVSQAESPLKELNNNCVEQSFDLKGLNSLRKHDNGMNKPIFQKITSISRSTTLKQNSYSTSKALLVQGTNSRKPSQHYIVSEGLSSIQSQILSKRR